MCCKIWEKKYRYLFLVKPPMLKINVSFKGIEEKLSKKYEKIVLLPCMHSAHIHHMRYLQKNSPNLEHCVGGGGELRWVLARGSRRGRHLTVLGGAIKIRLNYTVIVSNFVVSYTTWCCFGSRRCWWYWSRWPWYTSETKPNIKFRMRSACSPVLCDFCWQDSS